MSVRVEAGVVEDLGWFGWMDGWLGGGKEFDFHLIFFVIWI